METRQDTLFPLPPPDRRLLRVSRGLSHFSCMRLRKGQNLKISLRDCSTGKIVATIYGGEEMADHIVTCINSFGEEKHEKITEGQNPDDIHRNAVRRFQ